MGIAKRIRTLRMMGSHSLVEMARALDIPEEGYRLLEIHDRILIEELKLSQARKLAHKLGISLVSLFDDTALPTKFVSLRYAAKLLQARASAGNPSLPSMQRSFRWKLPWFISQPEQEAANRPILFLQDMAAHLSLDWRCFLLDEDAA